MVMLPPYLPPQILSREKLCEGARVIRTAIPRVLSQRTRRGSKKRWHLLHLKCRTWGASSSSRRGRSLSLDTVLTSSLHIYSTPLPFGMPCAGPGEARAAHHSHDHPRAPEVQSLQRDVKLPLAGRPLFKNPRR